MLDRFKGFWQGVMLAPFVKLFIKLGISPDVVTFVGTAGVAVGALAFFPTGHLWAGVLFITAFVFSDLIDGAMARATGRSSTFGSFWDSTLDRVADGAIFAGLALYFAGPGDSTLYTALCLYNLITGSVVSYARAKAESLGLDARGGLAERPDRLVLTLASAFFADVLDVPVLQEAALWLLAGLATYTVAFRVLKVYRQAVASDAARDAVAVPPPGRPPGRPATAPRRRRRRIAR